MYLTRQRRHQPLGGITDVLSAATKVVQDPCLGEVASLVLRLHELEQRPVMPGAPAKPAVPVQGIGLCGAVKPLRAVVYVRARPWLVPLGAIAIIGGLVGIGYVLGKP